MFRYKLNCYLHPVKVSMVGEHVLCEVCTLRPAEDGVAVYADVAPVVGGEGDADQRNGGHGRDGRHAQRVCAASRTHFQMTRFWFMANRRSVILATEQDRSSINVLLLLVLGEFSQIYLSCGCGASSVALS